MNKVFNFSKKETLNVATNFALLLAIVFIAMDGNDVCKLLGIPVLFIITMGVNYFDGVGVASKKQENTAQ